MDYTDLPLLKMMTKKMSWLSRRTEVISQNVANADTPGYGARDLKPVSFAEIVRKQLRTEEMAPVRTDERHLVSLKPVMPFQSEAAPDRYESALDGNDVSIEQQLTKLGETHMDYQMTLNLYKKQMDMFRTALTRPGR